MVYIYTLILIFPFGPSYYEMRTSESLNEEFELDITEFEFEISKSFEQFTVILLLVANINIKRNLRQCSATTPIFNHVQVPLPHPYRHKRTLKNSSLY